MLYSGLIFSLARHSDSEGEEEEDEDKSWKKKEDFWGGSKPYEGEPERKKSRKDPDARYVHCLLFHP